MDSDTLSKETTSHSRCNSCPIRLRGGVVCVSFLFGGGVMKCKFCGGLVVWETLRLTQTRCRRCDAVDSHVDDEEEEEAETDDGGNMREEVV